MPHEAKLWQVYHVPNCRHARPVPKAKFVVAVCRDFGPMAFFINKRINLYIQNRPELLIAQAMILKSQHSSWLKMDSYVDCTELFEFRDDELTSNRDLSPDAILEIKRAVSNSVRLERYYKELILR